MEREFGKYEFIEKIGSGGMAEVYLAKSHGAEGIEKILVIKRILPEFTSNRRFVDMFISEAKIAMELNHPNIVQIFDFGKVESDFYLAMEFVDGSDLAQLLSAGRRAESPLPLGEAVFIGVEIAKGLDYAHRRLDHFGEPLDIVHRDMSPQNVLISREGAVKIVDFGIAKASSVTDESPHVVKGKFSYMSPEQASGRRVDQRSDIFSLGVLLFELLCGRPLFKHTTQEETLSLVKSAVVPDILSLNPSIPPELVDLMYRTLSLEPDDRPQTARDIQVELTKVLYGLPEIHDPTTLSSYFTRVSRHVGEQGNEDHTAVASGSVGRTVPSAAQTATGSAQSGNTPVTRIAQPTDVPEWHARERKECIIVAGHLEGLFALRHALGQERWLQVLQEYTRIVDSIAYKNDAVVHRVNEDGFTLLFGVPVSTENDAERASRVAMDLHEAVAGMNPSLDAPISLSIGLAIGDVVLEQDVDHTGRRYSWSFFGSAHELAERLARAAMSREILVGGQIYRRIRRGYKLERVDQLPIDDEETQQFQAWRLLEPKSQQDRVSELRRSNHGFYGRDVTLKTMREQYRANTIEQRAGAFVILGRPGIGKSTLVEEFLRGLDPRNVRILRGVVPPYERDLPLAAIATLLSEMLRLGGREDLRQMRDNLAVRVTALFADEDVEERNIIAQSLGSLFGIRHSGSAFEELPGEERKQRIFRSMEKLITRFAEKKPLVIAIDDAHALDSMSLEFGAEYFGTTHKAPVTLILTADSAPVAESKEWKEFLTIKNLWSETIEELGEVESANLVRDMLRHHRINDPSLGEEITRRAGGNPLYIKEVVELLRDRGLMASADDAPFWMPSNVEGLLRARIDRLSIPLKSLLQRAALLWMPFSERDLRLVAPSDEAGTAELVALGLLERADLPVGGSDDTYDPEQTPHEDRTYRFCNALTQEVAARGLVPDEAAELHERLADFLMRTNDERKVYESALIAHHFDEAGQVGRSVEFYFQAADKALDQFGAAEALRLCDKVLERTEHDSPLRVEALKIRVRALSELGLKEETSRALEELDQLTVDAPPEDRADLLLRRARFSYDNSELRKSRDFVDLALAIAHDAGADSLVAESHLIHAMIMASEGTRDGALQLAELAVEQFSRLEGRGALEGYVKACNLVGVLHRQAGRHAAALAAYEAALEVAQKHDLRTQQRTLLTNSALALAYLGELSRSLERYETALGQARSLGNRREEAGILVNIGHTLSLIGDTETAMSSVRRGVYLARKTTSHQALADGLITLGACYLERGEHSKAEQSLQEGLRLADSIPHVYLSVQATLLLAQLNLAANNAADGARVALMQAEDALERSVAADMRWGVCYGHSLMARAYKGLGRRSDAIESSKKAVEIVNGGEIFGIDEVLYHHVQVLPDEEEHRVERTQAIRRAREVVLHRRDRIEDEEKRQMFMNRSMNRQILNAAKLIAGD
ncbi:MAG: protein kinase [bacterium]